MKFRRTAKSLRCLEFGLGEKHDNFVAYLLSSTIAFTLHHTIKANGRTY